MSSKIDLLRSGEPVEFKEGVFGRLNKEKKKLILSNGKTLDVSHEKELFPENEQQLKHYQRKEKIRGEVKESPFGAFGHQVSEGGIPGGIKKWYQKLTLPSEEYKQHRAAEEEITEELAEKHPYQSGAATLTNIGADFAALATLPVTATGAAIGGAGLALAHAGPRVIEEPGQVATEALISAGGGWALHHVAGGLGKIATRRAQSRAIKAEAPVVAERNAAQNEAYNIAKSEADAENAALLNQHRTLVGEQQQRAIDAKNSYIKARNDINADKFQRKQAKERAAQEEQKYQEFLKQEPKLQKAAQEEHAKKVIENAENIEKTFHPTYKLSGPQLRVKQFIDENIDKGGTGGTAPGNAAKRIIKAIFPEEESFAAGQLAKRYRALEESIQNSSPPVQAILTDFKAHLGERLPSALADNIAFDSVFPAFRTSVLQGVEKVIAGLGLKKTGEGSQSALQKIAKNNLNVILKKFKPEDFIEEMRSGRIQKILQENLLTTEDFLASLFKGSNVKNLKKQNVANLIKESSQAKELAKKYEMFSRQIAKDVDREISKAELKFAKSVSEASEKLKGKIEGTFGSAAPIQRPAAPQPYVEPPQIAPPAIPQAEAKIAQPNYKQVPPKPIAEEPPVLPLPQGISQRVGDFLERPLLGNANGGANPLRQIASSPLAPLGALKYLFGKGAAPVAATAYAGLRGLTAPNAAGAAARLTFRQAGISAITQWAEKYNSYHDGVLDDPRERRSLAKEIEDAPDMPLEQKALLQSKVNRGKPLVGKL